MRTKSAEGNNARVSRREAQDRKEAERGQQGLAGVRFAAGPAEQGETGAPRLNKPDRPIARRGHNADAANRAISRGITLAEDN
jgi:hypothetical protein